MNDLLNQLQQVIASAESDHADAEKWRTLQEALDQVGLAPSEPDDIVGLVVVANNFRLAVAELQGEIAARKASFQPRKQRAPWGSKRRAKEEPAPAGNGNGHVVA